jgi:hypothetical protein
MGHCQRHGRGSPRSRPVTLEHVIDKRPQADRILIAQLTGEARHRTRWRELSSDEEAAAVAELRELAGGRADLLAEVAGILEGAPEGQLDEPFARLAAALPGPEAGHPAHQQREARPARSRRGCPLVYVTELASPPSQRSDPSSGRAV